MLKLRDLHRACAASALVLLVGCGGAETPKAKDSAAVSSPALSETKASPVAVEVNELAAIDAAFLAAEATRGPGEPALWTLSDEDTVLHIFGTVHLLRPGTQWRSDTVEDAFDSADRLVLEVDASSVAAQQEMAQLIPEYGLFTGGETLLDHIDEDEAATISLASERVGVPLSGLARFKPWLVSVQISLLKIQKDGFDPSSGIEQVLTADALSDGKTFGYLETQSQQLAALSSGSMDAQVDGLLLAAKTIDRSTAMIDKMVAEWTDGDVAGLGVLLSEPELFGGEEAYQSLLVKRNRNWIPQIKDMLDDPGTTFIAVGAGHLAGPDSVIAMLRAEGLEVVGP